MTRIPLTIIGSPDIHWLPKDRGLAFLDRTYLVLHRLGDDEQVFIKTYLADGKWLAGLAYHPSSGMFSGDGDLFGGKPELLLGNEQSFRKLKALTAEGKEYREDLISFFLNDESLQTSSLENAADPPPAREESLRIKAPFDERPVDTLGCKTHFSGEQLAANECFFDNRPPSPEEAGNTLNIAWSKEEKAFVRLDGKTIYTDDYEISVSVVNNSDSYQSFLPSTFGAQYACVKNPRRGLL